MSRLAAVAREIVGLFVDDGPFAAAILACLVVAWLVLPRLPGLAGISGVLLFLGLAAALLVSAVGRARR